MPLIMNELTLAISWEQIWEVVSSAQTLYLFVAIGFVAQLIDGLLGMGYGVVTAISLMSLNMAPATVSASIHTAEMFASGASGYSHYRLGNVNRRLFKALLVPGVLGAVSGAFLLSYFGEHFSAWIKPTLAVYLLLLGLRILRQAFQQPGPSRPVRHIGWLARGAFWTPSAVAVGARWLPARYLCGAARLDILSALSASPSSLSPSPVLLPFLLPLAFRTGK